MEKSKKGPVLRWCAAFSIPLLLTALYLFFSRSKALADKAVRYFSRPVRDALGTLNALIPFSVMELIYAAAVIFILIYIILTVVRTVRSPKKAGTLLRRVLVLVLIVLYVASLYLAMWGIDYKSSSFSDKTGVSAGAVTTEDLYAVTKHFVLNAFLKAGNVKRDSGHFAEDYRDYFLRVDTLYDALSEEFPVLACSSRTPKAMIFSRIMSYMGFTGIYFPFTGESNLNVDAPAAFIPFTVAHELAHQRGVYAEQEANFLGVAACLSSGDPVYEYSGYLAGSLYLMNALYKADHDLWAELYASISGAYGTDWDDNNAYWRAFESPVTTASEKVYDTYLKANGQDLGIRSYGACVDMLVNYYKDKV